MQVHLNIQDELRYGTQILIYSTHRNTHGSVMTTECHYTLWQLRNQEMKNATDTTRIPFFTT